MPDSTQNSTPFNQPPACLWPIGPHQPNLLPGQVHIWCTSQEALLPHLEILRRTLSPDEMARANRFAFEHLRLTFAAFRGLLRLLLSRYVDALPAQLQFNYNAQGKPALAAPLTEPPVQFNLSHSGQVMLAALTLVHPLGVDVEAVRPLDDMHKLAQRYFAPPEAHRLQAAPPAQQPHTFFQQWALKEAYIKAIGLGLTFPTNQFEVLAAPGQTPRLVSVQGNAAALGWTLAALHPAPGYVGALAVQAGQPQLSCWQVPVDSWAAGSLKQ